MRGTLRAVIFFLIPAVTFWILPKNAEAIPLPGTSSPEAVVAFEPEATKLVLADATPVDPGQVEWVSNYTITGSHKQWNARARRSERRLLQGSVFETQANIGIARGFDIGITQGYAVLRDKENNYDETGGAVDENGESLDGTDGPHKGFGLTDLSLNLRWLLFRSQDHTLRIAHIPAITIPIGRRSNLDHLGPSQGYVSLDNTLALTKDLGRWTMSTNAGYEAPLAGMEKTENAAGTMTFGAGAGYHVLNWLQPQAEVVYAHDFESHGKGAKVVSVAAGLILPLNDHLRFDLGIAQDIAGSGADQTTSGVFKAVLLT